jgi:deoxyribonuclease V
VATEPWPETSDELELVQRSLAVETPPLWRPQEGVRLVAGCSICFERGRTGPGAPGDPGWAAAALIHEGTLAAVAVAYGLASAGYTSGLLALREGPLLEEAVRGLPALPEVLLVNATGRDHPRRAGLALHLGARLEIPSVGVTDRPFHAIGPWPADEPGATGPLRIAGEIVGYWVRTKRGARPLAIHAGWRTDPETGVSIVLSVTGKSRTPTPLREARRAAREARAGRHPSAVAAV